MADPSGAKPKISFGFKATAKPATPQPLVGAGRPAAFQALGGDNDDDDNGGDAGGPSSASNSARNKTKPKGPSGNLNLMGLAPGKSATPASRSDRKKQQEAEQLDAAVFDYDSVYDSMKEAEKRIKLAKQAESAERKPKYIGNFLESAEVRKRDRQRAEAKMIQREREAEGDEFADKEAFVTSAYKEQQQEIAKAEADEQRKEEQEREKSKGMGSFYRDMLNDTSAAREAAIAASLQAKPATEAEAEAASGVHQGAAGKAPTEAARAKSDAELAREAMQRGLNVELNDDNQIVDKRDLLAKGLNVVSKRQQQGSQDPRTREEERESREKRDQRRRAEYESRMNRDAQRARQSALIEEQMLELERKRKREEEEERQRERQKVDQKRNDDVAISSARQRYLERKKKKMEAAGAGSDAQPPP
ncbi:uncharacterized protein PFL1_03876 [Pseudozyma flocculosa PF-1]|uniref:Nuclear speckle splicing regulatory protein 1 N-terminal domain-containing protein n=2 Tax=Pseudozyma flocculosa TaxID=84751 RepID=A0A5C3EXC2_9BASI|nr:uncharacterized protein PFL1_03876 [Pseudozyma flocculosa PF-1]EPQ28572.1 hypothetical protein PFL1_03876 [Pseudozyma flocculosa PF-1]SPO36510.1 uncharacterized protein PSFLO_01981 [Pseudozyma flocculosa]